MGAKTSREEDASYSGASYQPSSTYSGSQYEQNYPRPSSSYPSQYEQNYPVQEAYPAYPPQGYNPPAAASPAPVPAPAHVHSTAPVSAPAYGGPAHRPQNKFDRRYSTIADSYSSLEQVPSCVTCGFSSYVDKGIFFNCYWFSFCMPIVLAEYVFWFLR